MGKRVVKNYPSPRLMETIGATNQKPAEAIGELVANCFDARHEAEKLVITIDMRSEQIMVIDNGKGMTSEVLEKAVCIAEDMSRHIERGEGAKGHFGMGFKTSCSTLGNYYEIYTRPVKGNVEYHTAFDISDYGTRPSGADAWDVVIEDSKPSKASPLGTAVHGTAFVIKSLKDRNITVSAVLDYMGEAFKSHIERGDKITIIDDSGSYDAVPKKYDFIKGTRIEINETFGPDDKYHITGWMALDSQTHNNGLYGFNIYRHDQLVEKYDKSWFRAHLMTSRIIGEVNMDFLDATFYKQGIQQSEDWQYVSIHMHNFLKGIVAASSNISKKGNIHNPSELKKIVASLHSDYGIEEEVSEQDYQSTDTKTEGGKKGNHSSINTSIKNIVTEEALILEDEGEVVITYLEKEDGGNVHAPFDYIFADSEEDDKAELQVMVFKNHPLWKKKTDDEVMRILATSDAIYRVLVEKLGFDTSKALKIRNEWLQKRTESMKG